MSRNSNNGKRAIRGTGEGWYAVAAMQGRRPHMEDTYHVLVPDASGPAAAADLHSLFGVFDGHGGKKVAQYLKESLLPAIVEAYANEKEVDGNDPNQQRTPTERLQAILPRTFLEIDEQCMADDRLSGSTAVVAILTETDIVVANVGDSRGIIYRTNEPSGRKSASRARSNDDDDDCPSDASLDSAPSEDDATDDDNCTDTDNDTDEEFVTDDEDDVHVKGKAKQAPGQEEGAKKKEKKKKRKYRKKPEEGDVGKTGRWQALSVDHKPNRPDERDRVEQAGGRVSKRPNDVWRFQNVLAVSRAFGDHGLKAGPGGAGLTANPEIKVFPRQDSDKFFVLASDGLWDVYTNEQAARVGRNALLQSSKNPAQEVANALANGAYKKESLDNITALVVLLEEVTTDSSSSSLSSSSDSATSPSLYTRSLHSEL